jgi:hypothetical protein
MAYLDYATSVVLHFSISSVYKSISAKFCPFKFVVPIEFDCGPRPLYFAATSLTSYRDRLETFGQGADKPEPENYELGV